MESGSRARRSLVAIGMAACLAGLALGATLASGNLSETSNTKQLLYPQPETSKAACAGKKHVGSGGFYTDTGTDFTPYAWITGSAPAGGDVDRWEATGHNSSAVQAAKLRSYGYCFSGPKPKVKKHTVGIPASGSFGVPGHSSANCPKGKTVIGGGFEIGIDDYPVAHQVVLQSMQRTGDKRGIEVEVVNEDDEEVELTAYAVCGKGKAPKETTKTIHIEAPGRENATSNCDKGEEALFGGFRGVYEDLGATSFFFSTPMALQRPSKGQVKASGYAVAGNEEQVDFTAIAYCR